MPETDVQAFLAPDLHIVRSHLQLDPSFSYLVVGSHHPSSPPSNKALALLRSSLSSPYPPNKTTNPPLEFNLDVVENPPTSDQLKIIMSYLPSKTASPSSAFLSAHPAAPSGTERPETTFGVANLAQQNPNAVRWPIVVDWVGGQASIGDVEGVKGILETLRQHRDGELPDEEVHRPTGWFS